MPRKLIRLSEALEFHHTSLKGLEDPEGVVQYWNRLSAARTLIIAQLYPNVYRLLRHGSSNDFWRMLFSLERLPSGEVGFSNRLQVAMIAAQQRAESARLERERREGQEGSEGKEESRLNPTEEAAAEQPLLCHWRREELARLLKEPTGAKEDCEMLLCHWLRIASDGTGKQNDPTTESYFSARALLDLLKDVEVTCNSRNGGGLLRLWDDEVGERDGLISGAVSEAEQIRAILGHSTVPEYEALNLYLRLPAQRAEPVIVAQEGAADERPAANAGIAGLEAAHRGSPRPAAEPQAGRREERSAVNTELAEEEREVEGVKDWLDAVMMGDSRSVDNYQALYDRRGEPANATAFTALLGRLCSLTAAERQSLCDKGWRQRVAPLLGRRQLAYLLDLVPTGWQGGEGTQQRFVLQEGGEVVLDRYTGLEWQRSLAEGGKDMTYEGAKELDSRASGDWGLPTPRELQSLVDYSSSSPAIVGQGVDGGDDLFPQTPSYWFWSSPVAGVPEDAWVVGFGFGFVDRYGRDGNGRLRLVRGGSRSVSIIEAASREESESE